MFRIPKAIKEINKIQEKISRTRKITDKDFIEKTRQSVRAFKQKQGVKVVVANV